MKYYYDEEEKLKRILVVKSILDEKTVDFIEPCERTLSQLESMKFYMNDLSFMINEMIAITIKHLNGD